MLLDVSVLSQKNDNKSNEDNKNSNFHQIAQNTKNERQELMEKEFEDTKGVIRIRKSKKDRQHNGKK